MAGLVQIFQVPGGLVGNAKSRNHARIRAASKGRRRKRESVRRMAIPAGKRRMRCWSGAKGDIGSRLKLNMLMLFRRA